MIVLLDTTVLIDALRQRTNLLARLSRLAEQLEVLSDVIGDVPIEIEANSRIIFLNPIGEEAEKFLNQLIASHNDEDKVEFRKPVCEGPDAA